MTRKVAVVGSGSWGTAFTGIVADKADEVVLWCRSAQVADTINQTGRNPRHLSDYQLAPNVTATHNAAEALDGADVVVLAVPSAHLRSVCHDIAAHVEPASRVLVLTKGMERGSHKLMLDVAADELGNESRMAVLSGPNHAEEICCGKVSAAVCASRNAECAQELCNLCFGPAFRVYVSDDVTGVEVCGAVKNVIAICCGIAAGLGAGDNTLAVLMTRGIAEIGRICAALGANPLTPMGLAGMGDLVATCTSQHSRNRTFGEAIVAGETLEQYETRTGMVVEGAQAAISIHQLADELDIEAPITQAVHGVLMDGIDVKAARQALLGRLPREEFYGINHQQGRGKK